MPAPSAQEAAPYTRPDKIPVSMFPLVRGVHGNEIRPPCAPKRSFRCSGSSRCRVSSIRLPPRGGLDDVALLAAEQVAVVTDAEPYDVLSQQGDKFGRNGDFPDRRGTEPEYVPYHEP
jgi:hypothetical protein